MIFDFMETVKYFYIYIIKDLHAVIRANILE